MSDELQKQITIEETISDESRGQTSDQDVVRRIRDAVKANLPGKLKYGFTAPSFDEFFVEVDYYYILQQWLSIKDSLTGMKLYGRIFCSGSKCFQVDFNITRDEINIRNGLQRTIYVFLPKIFFEKGFTDIRDCVLIAAGLYFEEGHVFPKGVSELFSHACVQVSDDLEDIQNKSLDLIVRLGDLRIFSESMKICGFNNIYEFCYVTFGLSRTTVKNMLEIYDKFYDHCHLKDEFSEYGYSQLVELCSVDSKDLDKYDASMSVREIKAKKKELAQAALSKPDEAFKASPVVGEVEETDSVVSVSSEEAKTPSDSVAECVPEACLC